MPFFPATCGLFPQVMPFFLATCGLFPQVRPFLPATCGLEVEEYAEGVGVEGGASAGLKDGAGTIFGVNA